VLIGLWPNLQSVVLSSEKDFGITDYTAVEYLNSHIDVARRIMGLRNEILARNGSEESEFLIPHDFLSRDYPYFDDFH
ncbi:hypothetical protein FS749_014052, partial [Ceratobasidium sp. UAMH 11750]